MDSEQRGAHRMTDDNILSRIPGELLAPTRNDLLQAQPDGPDTQRVLIRLPDGARAEVTYLNSRARKAKRRAGIRRRTAPLS